MRFPALLLIPIIAIPLQAQVLSAGLGYGSQSSYQYPMFVTGEIGVDYSMGAA